MYAALLLVHVYVCLWLCSQAAGRVCLSMYLRGGGGGGGGDSVNG